MKVGRPTKRTPEVVAIIAKAIANGFNDEEAALVADIEPETLSQWKKIPEFSKAIRAGAQKRMEIRLSKIERGEPGWQGTAWILERVHKDRFAKPDVAFAQQINIAGKSIEIQLNPEHLKRLSDAYDEEMGTGDSRNLSEEQSAITPLPEASEGTTSQ